mmetsp:Transcript_13774/g.21276  ORF Transcript_13774/g.21276 Transcript_13774/m.21276 type:complete len:101 (-) Transcript_13774:161-463(-)
MSVNIGESGFSESYHAHQLREKKNFFERFENLGLDGRKNLAKFRRGFRQIRHTTILFRKKSTFTTTSPGRQLVPLRETPSFRRPKLILDYFHSGTQKIFF